jgi:hypothetical protein
VILTGLLTGFIGSIKVQGVIIPLNIELREGCLRDPALVDPQLPCPKQAEAILRYPDGRTVVIRGTPQQVQRRMDPAVATVVAAARRGVPAGGGAAGGQRDRGDRLGAGAPSATAHQAREPAWRRRQFARRVRSPCCHLASAACQRGKCAVAFL